MNIIRMLELEKLETSGLSVWETRSIPLSTIFLPPPWIIGSWTDVLEECSVGDEILYHRDLSGITAPKLDTTDKAAIYDLSGRRLQTAPQRGVYIVNGKKYIR